MLAFLSTDVLDSGLMVARTSIGFLHGRAVPGSLGRFLPVNAIAVGLIRTLIGRGLKIRMREKTRLLSSWYANFAGLYAIGLVWIDSPGPAVGSCRRC